MQSESLNLSGLVDKGVSTIRAQGYEFEREVKPLSPMLCGWGPGVRSRLAGGLHLINAPNDLATYAM